MGTISFSLPPDVPQDMAGDFQSACLAGGFDHAPSPTQVQTSGTTLSLTRTLDESGFLITPWQIESVGRLMTSTATLIERDEPYSAAVELARGKVNQIRNHLAEWAPLGIELPPAMQQQMSQISRGFGQLMSDYPSPQSDRKAQEILTQSFKFVEDFSRYFAQELFQIRHQRIPRLETAFGVQMGRLPRDPNVLTSPFNILRLAFNWRLVEAAEAHYDWYAIDEALDWAEDRGIPVVAGPLIDFSPSGLPDWINSWRGDLPNIANFMCDYVETVIARYRRRLTHWYLASACNIAGTLGLSEDDMLWLTARLAESALQMAPELDISFGVVQPWAEYMAREEHTYTPLVFLDTLLRTGLRMKALNIEVVMGVAKRGSYCRDLLELSRLLDSFAVLSAPLHITMGVPSDAGVDPLAEPGLTVGFGGWEGGFNPAFQADWAEKFVNVALSKPYVTGLFWANLSDAAPHRFPHCGLLDANDQPRPALEVFRDVRQQHLK
jgi:hypothetical protein